MTASGGGGTFHDYTLASNGERLVAVLEAALSAWSQAGLQSILRAGASRGHRTPPSVVKVQVALKHRCAASRGGSAVALTLRHAGAQPR